jgi:hypothetical protein
MPLKYVVISIDVMLQVSHIIIMKHIEIWLCDMHNILMNIHILELHRACVVFHTVCTVALFC